MRADHGAARPAEQARRVAGRPPTHGDTGAAGEATRGACLRSGRLADGRVWPSIDISQSGTRREERLHDEETYEAVTMLRRTMSSMHPCDAMEQLTKQLGRFETNDEFIKLISGAKTTL